MSSQQRYVLSPSLSDLPVSPTVPVIWCADHFSGGPLKRKCGRLSRVRPRQLARSCSVLVGPICYSCPFGSERWICKAGAPHLTYSCDGRRVSVGDYQFITETLLAAIDTDPLHSPKGLVWQSPSTGLACTTITGDFP